MSRSRRALPTLVAAGLVVALVAALAGVASPASAKGGKDPLCTSYHGCPGDRSEMTYTRRSSWDAICWGYDGCKDAGYKSFGYKKAKSHMYWRMYAGHNCTNYVAYRMVDNGLPDARPWSGGGNAENWGKALRSKTDSTPRVGAIAWWAANADPVGSSGHVAYVEEVLSSGELLVSEDNWGGDFDWRRVKKSAGGWPTGFIHLTDARVVNKAAPTVTGDVRVGSAVKAGPGRWKHAASYSYQWLVDGVAVKRATSATFTLKPGRLGKAVSVRVTASRAGYAPATATSGTRSVAAGRMSATRAPQITGTPQVDEVLTLGRATFSPAATATSVQWRADGVDIPGATGTSLRLDQAQANRMITAVVTGTRKGYATASTSAPGVGPVLAPRITLQQAPTLAGRSRIGRVLTVSPGAFTPDDASVAVTWLRGHHVIAGADGTSYELGVQDVGKRVKARVTYSRERYLDRVVTLRRHERVTTPSRMSMRAVGKRRHAVLHVRVRAEGATPRGKVSVTIGGHTSRVRLADGRLRVSLPLAVGQHRIRVKYAGTAVVGRSHASARVRVAGR